MMKEVNISNVDARLDVGQSTWITVNNLSVHIKANDEGVSVAVYSLGKEEEGSIIETWGLYSEGGDDEEE